MKNDIKMKYDQTSNDDTWTIETDGKYISVIEKYLEDDGIPKNGIDGIVKNAADALSYCPDPKGTGISQKTGIVIGKVQSGKTSTFISIAALAFDNGYNLIVVFGGTKKLLVQQNRERINEYFKKAKDVIVLDTTDYKEELTAQKMCQFFQMGRKVIIVTLKTPNQINYLTENIFGDPSFTDIPVLIIDDEGDEASLNTLVKQGKKSATYKAIENIKSKLNRHCFLSITATPQANLLIDTLDILSPDFGILVPPGEGYCGLDVFHSDGKYIREIPSSETSLLEDGIPKSFKDALSMFFVACAIQKNRESGTSQKLSMLIHPSQIKADHAIVYDKVVELIADWRQQAEDKKDVAYTTLRKRFINAYKDYEKSGVKDLPKFELIENDIIQALNFCACHKVNGDSCDSVPNKADELYDYNIYVGGAMLGRGLTIKGLVITYITRNSKGASTADTVTQRARWFGYKADYLDLCRIYAVKGIIEDYLAIRNHEEDIWETVKQANCQGTHFKDMARIFALDDKLKMTRTNVAKTKSYSYKFWNKQRKFQSDEDYIRNNMAILNTVRKEFNNSLITESYGNGAPYVIAKDVEFKYVKDNIFDKFCFVSDEEFNGSVIDKLDILLTRKKLDPKVDIIWMRDGIYSKHNIECGYIPNYSVGRRPDDPSKPTIYEGDDYQFIRNDTMQLQIHMIQDTSTRIVSPTLAFYIPKDVISELTGLIIKS